MNINQNKISIQKIAGFSLLELLVSLAILGIVSATSLPAYRSYINLAQTTVVSHAYDTAVKSARQEYSKNTTRVILGLPSTLPASDATWIQVFAGNNISLAPDGGLAYRAGHQPKDETTPSGAVYVKFHPDHVCISRNQFNELIALKTRIYVDKIQVVEL